MRKALVVGCSGQDGTYLCELLAAKGYALFGIARRAPRVDMVQIEPVSLDDPGGPAAVMEKCRPDEVYYLAAYHESSEGTEGSEQYAATRSLQVNTVAFGRFLEAAKVVCPRTRVFYAASSRVFGTPPAAFQDEQTPMNPTCFYGVSKAAGIGLCRVFRNSGLYVGSGILYNHESPLRTAQFVSKKVVRAAVRISRGQETGLVVGSLDATVDWGWAPDYMAAAWSILQQDEPDDFVIASGHLHSVRDLVAEAFAAVNLDWRSHVTERPGVIRPGTKPVMCGNSRKLQERTGWRPTVSFEDMIRRMVRSELLEVENE